MIFSFQRPSHIAISDEKHSEIGICDMKVYSYLDNFEWKNKNKKRNEG